MKLAYCSEDESDLENATRYEAVPPIELANTSSAGDPRPQSESRLGRRRSLLAGDYDDESVDPSLQYLFETMQNAALPAGERMRKEITESRTPPLDILSAYREPPRVLATEIWTLEETSRARVEILHFLNAQFGSSASSTGHDRDTVWANVISYLTDRLRACGFETDSTSLVERRLCRFRDALSHFMLRLAFVNDRAAQEWFVRGESALLEARLRVAGTFFDRLVSAEDLNPLRTEPMWLERLRPLLKSLEIPYEVIHLKSNPLNPDIQAVFRSQPQSVKSGPNMVLKPEGAGVSYEASGTVHAGTRSMHAPAEGDCYIFFSDVDSVIISKFRLMLQKSFATLLMKQLTLQNVYQTEVITDTVVGPLIRELQKNYLAFSPTGIQRSNALLQGVEPLTQANIEKLAMRSFPPCMKRLYVELKRARHLKHWGRMQLWLFLKGCGMSLDDQITWWRSLWMDPAKFDKEIKYNIRHSYGQEGQRKDYSPFSCSKIIINIPTSCINNLRNGCFPSDGSLATSIGEDAAQSLLVFPRSRLNPTNVMGALSATST